MGIINSNENEINPDIIKSKKILDLKENEPGRLGDDVDVAIQDLDAQSAGPDGQLNESEIQAIDPSLSAEIDEELKEFPYEKISSFAQEMANLEQGSSRLYHVYLDSRSLIFNEDEVRKRHRAWVSLTGIIKVHDVLKERPLDFLNTCKTLLEKDPLLKLSHPEIAAVIAEIPTVNQTETEKLIDIRSIASAEVNSKDSGTGVLKAKLVQLQDEIKSLSDQDFARRLFPSLEIASGIEVEYLEEEIKHIENENKPEQHLKPNLDEYVQTIELGIESKKIKDVWLIRQLKKIDTGKLILLEKELEDLKLFKNEIANWTNDMVPDPIPDSNVFKQRVFRLRQFAAMLLKTYKDHLVYTELMKRSVVRKLLYYFTEYDFIQNTIITPIKKAYDEEKDWESFKNMIKSFQQIKNTLIRYGDSESAEELSKLGAPQKSDLMGWRMTIVKIIQSNYNNPGKKTQLLQGCVTEVQKVIAWRINLLETEIEKINGNLISLLKSRKEQLEKSRLSAARKIVALVEDKLSETKNSALRLRQRIEKKDKIISKDWDVVKQKYRAPEEKIIALMTQIKQLLEEFNADDTTRILNKLNELSATYSRDANEGRRLFESAQNKVMKIKSPKDIDRKDLINASVEVTIAASKLSSSVGMIDYYSGLLLEIVTDEKHIQKKTSNITKIVERYNELIVVLKFLEEQVRLDRQKFFIENMSGYIYYDSLLRNLNNGNRG